MEHRIKSRSVVKPKVLLAPELQSTLDERINIEGKCFPRMIKTAKQSSIKLNEV